MHAFSAQQRTPAVMLVGTGLGVALSMLLGAVWLRVLWVSRLASVWQLLPAQAYQPCHQLRQVAHVVTACYRTGKATEISQVGSLQRHTASCCKGTRQSAGRHKQDVSGLLYSTQQDNVCKFERLQSHRRQVHGGRQREGSEYNFQTYNHFARNNVLYKHCTVQQVLTPTDCTRQHTPHVRQMAYRITLLLTRT